MNDKVAIKVENVSKKYCKSLKRSMLYGVKDIGKNILGMSSHSEDLRKEEFWALDDVSFKVKKGETFVNYIIVSYKLYNLQITKHKRKSTKTN